MPGQQSQDFVTLADVEIDAVLPGRQGFLLEGRGADGADYQMDMHLDIPVDDRTRTVLGEILTQSEWKVRRRVRTPLRQRARARSEQPR